MSRTINLKIILKIERHTFSKRALAPNLILEMARRILKSRGDDSLSVSSDNNVGKNEIKFEMFALTCSVKKKNFKKLLNNFEFDENNRIQKYKPLDFCGAG